MLLSCCCCQFLPAQVKYAGALKNLVGKTFVNEKQNTLLKGYSWREGELITAVNDPQPQFLMMYIKGSEAVVLYSAKTETAANQFTIIDVLAIKNVLPGWELRIAGCTEGQVEAEIIVALVKPGKGKYTSAAKALQINRDKLRIETLAVKGITCINEEGD